MEPGGTSPIELLHADGVVTSALVIGQGCPSLLLPEHVAETSTGPVDLVVVAPTPDECGRREWLEGAARAATTAAAPNALVYVLARPRARRRLGRLLTRNGLERVGSFLHVPDPGATRHLVPLEGGPFRYAFSRLVPTSARTRRLTTLLRRVPWLGPVTWAAWSVGTAFVRRGSRPPLAWLGSGPVTAIVSRPQAGNGAPIVHAFPAGATRPSFVAKLTADEAGARARAEALTRLGPSAATAGALVPRVLGHELGGRPAVVESPVPGTNAYAVLLAQPDRFTSVVDALTGWLERWSAATATEQVVTAGLLDELVLRPLGTLERDGVRLSGLRSRLDRLGERLEGTSAPLVAVHRDLTMSNVLVDGDRVGVVDWEHATERGLPLTDFFYAVADAAAAETAYADRVTAARSCFEPGGARSEDVARWQARLTNVLGLPDELQELCFHACWLHHAANEAQAPHQARPFRALVEWAAEKPR